MGPPHHCLCLGSGGDREIGKRREMPLPCCVYVWQRRERERGTGVVCTQIGENKEERERAGTYQKEELPCGCLHLCMFSGGVIGKW